MLNFSARIHTWRGWLELLTTDLKIVFPWWILKRRPFKLEVLPVYRLAVTCRYISYKYLSGYADPIRTRFSWLWRYFYFELLHWHSCMSAAISPFTCSFWSPRNHDKLVQSATQTDMNSSKLIASSETSARMSFVFFFLLDRPPATWLTGMWSSKGLYPRQTRGCQYRYKYRIRQRLKHGTGVETFKITIKSKLFKKVVTKR
jgi:hypothetical protein